MYFEYFAQKCRGGGSTPMTKKGRLKAALSQTKPNHY